MFTGIVEDLGKVLEIHKKIDGKKVVFQSSFNKELNLGDSIAINGACLTVVSTTDNTFTVDVVQETLDLTNLNTLLVDDIVNLERCMKLGDRINGHIVTGHIDGVCKILFKKNNETQTDLIIELDSSLIDNCIYKGSICLDGISLTIAGIDNNNVKLAIIPYTIKNTTLKTKEVDDMLNVETDMFAKYVNNMQLGDK